MIDKHKADDGKAPISLVPTGIIWEIAKVRNYGVNVMYPETGRDGWRNLSKERIANAMLRHILRYLDDPDGVDDESGLPHLSHAATNIAFLIELDRKDSMKHEIMRAFNCKGKVGALCDYCKYLVDDGNEKNCIASDCGVYPEHFVGKGMED